MARDNPSGADNQQERPGPTDWLNSIPSDLGNWVAGFVDGEGSFNIPIRREHDRGMPWRVGLSFNVSQVGDSAPSLLRSVFGAGTTRARGDGIHYFEVTKPTELAQKVVPFFERFPLRTSKAGDLVIFSMILELVQQRLHLRPHGLRTAMALRNLMNRGGKRHRSDSEILEVLRDWESSEAIRKAPR